ncbi:hypothetical protein J1C56_27960 [Aminobacter anthyllidis]|uniref:Uncharacterized protein n=1 Tax=Aminobacter anthyllidis TaxID=1035067 RepID=A0A9X1AGE1_9HYPH|nr:hypothetical protein [Aminobacter anthyllidis]MBT1159410.1 hypothetical protein [Aminobacter anthyllidis]
MIDLTDTSVSALLGLHGICLQSCGGARWCAARTIPPAITGELLFSRAFGWTLSSDADGVRCRKLEALGGSRQLGLIRRMPDRPFDRLATVLLDGKFRVRAAEQAI